MIVTPLPTGIVMVLPALPPDGVVIFEPALMATVLTNVFKATSRYFLR